MKHEDMTSLGYIGHDRREDGEQIVRLEEMYPSCGAVAEANKELMVSTWITLDPCGERMWFQPVEETKDGVRVKGGEYHRESPFHFDSEYYANIRRCFFYIGGIDGINMLHRHSAAFLLAECVNHQEFFQMALRVQKANKKLASEGSNLRVLMPSFSSSDWSPYLDTEMWGPAYNEEKRLVAPGNIMEMWFYSDGSNAGYEDYHDAPAWPGAANTVRPSYGPNFLTLRQAKEMGLDVDVVVPSWKIVGVHTGRGLILSVDDGTPLVNVMVSTQDDGQDRTPHGKFIDDLDILRYIFWRNPDAQDGELSPDEWWNLATQGHYVIDETRSITLNRELYGVYFHKSPQHGITAWNERCRVLLYGGEVPKWGAANAMDILREKMSDVKSRGDRLLAWCSWSSAVLVTAFLIHSMLVPWVTSFMNFTRESGSQAFLDQQAQAAAGYVPFGVGVLGSTAVFFVMLTFAQVSVTLRRKILHWADASIARTGRVGAPFQTSPKVNAGAHSWRNIK